MRRPKPKREWKFEVTFIPLESGRDEAYRDWIRVFLKGKKGEMEFLERKRKHEEVSSD